MGDWDGEAFEVKEKIPDLERLREGVRLERTEAEKRELGEETEVTL